MNTDMLTKLRQIAGAASPELGETGAVQMGEAGGITVYVRGLYGHFYGVLDMQTDQQTANIAYLHAFGPGTTLRLLDEIDHWRRMYDQLAKEYAVQSAELHATHSVARRAHAELERAQGHAEDALQRLQAGHQRSAEKALQRIIYRPAIRNAGN